MSEKKTILNGTVIFKQGEFEMKMYNIISGKVAIYTGYGTENEKLLAEMVPGQFFGEMGVVDGMPRSATAVAAEDTQVEVIEQSEFMQYLDENHDKAIAIIKTLSSRLRGLTLDYMEACGTIAEIYKEKPAEKKGGLWDKMKKFAELGQEYADAYNNLQSSEPSTLECIEKAYEEYGRNPFSIIFHKK